MATEDVVKIVKAEIERLESVLKILVADSPVVIEPTNEAPAPTPVPVKIPAPISEPSKKAAKKETHPNMSAAMRKRWEEARKAGKILGKKSVEPAPAQPSAAPPAEKPKRKMSPEGLASFRAAMKKRQAAKKKQVKANARAASE